MEVFVPMLMRPALEEECWATIAVTLQSSYEWYEAAVESAVESTGRGTAGKGTAVEGAGEATLLDHELLHAPVLDARIQPGAACGHVSRCWHQVWHGASLQLGHTWMVSEVAAYHRPL